MKSATLPRLLFFLRPLWRLVLLSVLLGVITVISGIGLLGTSAYLIASAALQPSVAALQVAIVGVRFLGINRAVFRYLERLVSHSANLRLLAELRVWFYRALEPLAPARLQSHRSADLLSRSISDIETLENFYVRAVAPPLVALVVTACAGWFLGRYDMRIALVLVIAHFLAGAILPILVHFLNHTPGVALVEQRAALHAVLLDAVQGMPDLLAFGQRERQLQRIAAAGRSVNQSQWRLARSGALANAFLLLLTGLALWGVLVLAIPLVGARIDGIILAVLVLVVMASFEAVQPLIPAAQHLESSLQAARRLFALVDASPAVTMPTQPLPLPPSLDLQISNLTFSYPETSRPALSNFQLDLPPGKRVALLGASGSGKTTLLNLLLRFWDVAPGQILLSGQDIRAYDPDELRKQIAVIGQSTYLFSGTLRQNLLIAQPAAAPEDLERVLKQAQLGEIVAQMPHGLDSWVGEHGMQLSGGERQRLAIARALLCDAQIWLLDEPAANLDAANESRLLAVLAQTTQDRSVIYITHHLTGLEGMDEVIVLKDGALVERGTQAELQALGGLFCRMLDLRSEMLLDECGPIA